ncbi:MAG TPA: hypothetical protein VGE21_02625 [Flavobacteriales bacterium]
MAEEEKGGGKIQKVEVAAPLPVPVSVMNANPVPVVIHAPVPIPVVTEVRSLFSAGDYYRMINPFSGQDHGLYLFKVVAGDMANVAAVDPNNPKQELWNANIHLASLPYAWRHVPRP